MNSSSAPIFVQLLSLLYVLGLVGIVIFLIYSLNSIRKSQRSMAATLEKILVHFQEKDMEETKK